MFAEQIPDSMLVGERLSVLTSTTIHGSLRLSPDLFHQLILVSEQKSIMRATLRLAVQ